MLDRYLSLKKPILKSLINERRRARASDSSTPLLSSSASASAGTHHSTSSYQTLPEKNSTEHIEMPSRNSPQNPSLFLHLQRTPSKSEKKNISYMVNSAPTSPTMSSSPTAPTFRSLGSGRHANQWLFDAEGWKRFLGRS